MQARIYSPAKTAMQSGKSKTGHWVLEFEGQGAKRVEPLMGYTSSTDTRAQLKLKFDSREDAENYAQRNGIAYIVMEPKQPKRRRVAYSDNFKYDRRQPWTH